MTPIEETLRGALILAREHMVPAINSPRDREACKRVDDVIKWTGDPKWCAAHADPDLFG